MIQVVDPPQGDEGPASQGAFDVGPASQLANDSSRLWSALAETSGAAVSRFSRLVSWHVDIQIVFTKKRLVTVRQNM